MSDLDLSPCNFGQHLSCSGYTNNEFDPDLCGCDCHIPEEQR